MLSRLNHTDLNGTGNLNLEKWHSLGTICCDNQKRRRRLRQKLFTKCCNDTVLLTNYLSTFQLVFFVIYDDDIDDFNYTSMKQVH